MRQSLKLIGFVIFSLSWAITILIVGDLKEPEIFLIPKEFRGKILVFYSQKDGKEEKYENGYRIYELPRYGILKTQFSPNIGSILLEDLHFYYINENGEKEKLEYVSIHSCDRNDSIRIVVVGGKMGVFNDNLTYEEYIIDICSRINQYDILDNISYYLNSKKPLPKKKMYLEEKK